MLVISVATKKFEIIATIYDRGGRELISSKNSYRKTHPYQARIAKRVGLEEKVFLHAEIAAIIKLQKVAPNSVPYKIKIERYDSYGRPKLAKPCPVCEEAIRLAGIKFVEYTVG